MSFFSTLQVKYKEVKARNAQLLKMLQQGESELNIAKITLDSPPSFSFFPFLSFPNEELM